MKKETQNTLKFSNNNINKFIFLLNKRIYPDEYIDEWKKFNETSSPEREKIHSNYGRYYRCRLHACKKSF